LNNELIVQAWKNPQIRSNFANLPVHPAGEALVPFDLNLGDVQAETTPATPWIIASSEPCGYVASTIIISVTSC